MPKPPIFDITIMHLFFEYMDPFRWCKGHSLADRCLLRGPLRGMNPDMDSLSLDDQSTKKSDASMHFPIPVRPDL